MNPLTALDHSWKNHLFSIELQNGIQQFAIRLSQSPAIAF